jgi:tRNA(fMet)-specific endonuclease VapC
VFLLDTNICVYAIKRQPVVLQHLKQHSPDDVAVSAVTLAELWFGARKSSQPDKTRKAVDAFLSPFRVFDFDRSAAEAYASLRLHLQQQPIGERDLLIASVASSRHLSVVTHNTREFSRVPGLSVKDWLSPGSSAGPF